MKRVRFVGDSKKRLLAFSDSAQNLLGFELWRVQLGLEPNDSKTLVGLPLGIKEIRIWSGGDTFRLVYVAKFPEAVYVLHAFEKKTEATALRDINLVRKRYEEVRAGR